MAKAKRAAKVAAKEQASVKGERHQKRKILPNEVVKAKMARSEVDVADCASGAMNLWDNIAAKLRDKRQSQ